MSVRGLVLVILALCSWEKAGAGTPDSLYNEGNALYRRGEYDTAITKYVKVLGMGMRNADVHYNLGNAYYKRGSLGLAMLHYERARRLRPADADILANIAFADAVKVDRFDLEPPNAVTRFLAAVYRSLSPNALSVWVTLALLIACIGGGGLLFGKTRRVQWIILIAFCVVGFLAGGALLTSKVADLRSPEGIILHAVAVGRSGPGDDYLQVFTLHEGTKVVIERREGLWVLVRLPNGIGGWIKLDTIGII